MKEQTLGGADEGSQPGGCSLHCGHWLPSGGGGVYGVAGMLGILGWLSKHSNWLGVLSTLQRLSAVSLASMTILGLKILGLGGSLGCLSISALDHSFFRWYQQTC